MGRAVVDSRDACFIGEKVRVSYQPHPDSLQRPSGDLLYGGIERLHDRVIGAGFKRFTRSF